MTDRDPDPVPEVPLLPSQYEGLAATLVIARRHVAAGRVATAKALLRSRLDEARPDDPAYAAAAELLAALLDEQPP